MHYRDWHQRHKASRDLLDRIADGVTDFIGSVVSVIIHTIMFAWWFYHGLDVGLLTNVVSLEAIYLCIFLQMSSNRHGERDRHQAEADYITNLRSERRIEEVEEALARIEVEKLDQILKLLQVKRK